MMKETMYVFTRDVDVLGSPLMLECAESVVEHATHYAQRSTSSSYIWYDHRKFYDKNLVLLPLGCCGQRAIRFHGCTFVRFFKSSSSRD
jgi:hypothetical protein